MGFAVRAQYFFVLDLIFFSFIFLLIKNVQVYTLIFHFILGSSLL